MAKTERQRRSLKSDDFFFDSDASLLDQQDFDMSSCAFNEVFNSKDSHMEQITFLKNVQVLLEAARFLESAERKDGKCEHGYASTFPSNQSTNYQRQRKFRNKKFSSNHNRSTHNELEKNSPYGSSTSSNFWSNFRPDRSIFQCLSSLCICSWRDDLPCMASTGVDNLCNVQTLRDSGDR
ncbi:hypothetical protein AMECASPLE_007703 [Ameca splendens]|uniref:Uncharacterized protein n=1 Tax=Ameca splendens TaxID=208324 RepID=A0ABV0YXZ0_9TELE